MRVGLTDSWLPFQRSLPQPPSTTWPAFGEAFEGLELEFAADIAVDAVYRRAKPSVTSGLVFAEEVQALMPIKPRAAVVPNECFVGLSSFNLGIFTHALR